MCVRKTAPIVCRGGLLLDGELLPAPTAAARNDFPAGLGFHARHKTVLAGAFRFLGPETGDFHSGV